MAGCDEEVAMAWRSTRSHTPEQMDSVYKELFFAGFPSPASNSTDDESGPPAAASFIPSAFVRSMFEPYGAIEAFQFDERRGVGAVTFTSGEAAQQCYHCANLSVIVQPEQLVARRCNAGRRMNDDDFRDEVGPLDIALLYIEFAAYVPFVNPMLLDERVRVRGSASRMFLRTFPTWRHGTATRGRDSGCIEELTGGAMDHTCRFAAEVFRWLSREEGGGGGEARVVIHDDAASAAAAKVRMMDLWWVYFEIVVRPTSATSGHSFLARHAALRSAVTKAQSGGGDAGFGLVNNGSRRAVSYYGQLVHDCVASFKKRTTSEPQTVGEQQPKAAPAGGQRPSSSGSARPSLLFSKTPSCGLFNQLRREEGGLEFRYAMAALLFRVRMCDEPLQEAFAVWLRCPRNERLRGANDMTTALHDVVHNNNNNSQLAAANASQETSSVRDESGKHQHQTGTLASANEASRARWDRLTLSDLALNALRRHHGSVEALERHLNDSAASGSRDSLLRIVDDISDAEIEADRLGGLGWRPVLRMVVHILRAPLVFAMVVAVVGGLAVVFLNAGTRSSSVMATAPSVSLEAHHRH